MNAIEFFNSVDYVELRYKNNRVYPIRYYKKYNNGYNIYEFHSRFIPMGWIKNLEVKNDNTY